MSRGAEDTSIRAALVSMFDRLEEAKALGGARVTTGIAKLDEFVMLSPGGFTIIAARPTMGKSAWVKDILLHNAFRGVPSVLFSEEDDRESWCTRATSGLTGIPHSQVRSYKLDAEGYDSMMTQADRLSVTPLHINDKMLSVPQIRAEARRAVSEHGIELFVIDYLQLVPRPSSRESTADQVARQSRGLKALARETGTHVICLSQLNRECEKRTGSNPPCIPKPSDLRDSGSLEQDADIIMFPYRHNVYNQSADASKAVIVVAKNKHGRQGAVEVVWDAARVRFQNVQPWRAE